jgi:hypothetical protein
MVASLAHHHTFSSSSQHVLDDATDWLINLVANSPARLPTNTLPKTSQSPTSSQIHNSILQKAVPSILLFLYPAFFSLKKQETATDGCLLL